MEGWSNSHTNRMGQFMETSFMPCLLLEINCHSSLLSKLYITVKHQLISSLTWRHNAYNHITFNSQLVPHDEAACASSHSSDSQPDWCTLTEWQLGNTCF